MVKKVAKKTPPREKETPPGEKARKAAKKVNVVGGYIYMLCFGSEGHCSKHLHSVDQAVLPTPLGTCPPLLREEGLVYCTINVFEGR